MPIPDSPSSKARITRSPLRLAKHRGSIAHWLRYLWDRGQQKQEAAPMALELLARTGMDAGQRFTIDGDEILIGRKLSPTQESRGIMLHDPTVSSRQAIVRLENGTLVLHHAPQATNPTLVNERPISSHVLKAGLCIRFGAVELDVQNREGFTVSDLTKVFAVPPAEVIDIRSDSPTASAPSQSPASQLHEQATEIRPLLLTTGRLIAEKAPRKSEAMTFPVTAAVTTLGRSRASDMVFSDPGVSRNHAEIVKKGSDLVLHSRSDSNPTHLNGIAIEQPTILANGDKIQLSDQAIIRVEIREDSPFDTVTSQPVGQESSRSARGLVEHVEERVKLDEQIERDFSVEGSFLDVDVVDSYGLKADTNRPEHIVVSFERFRSYVGKIIAEHSGYVLTSNGDELMCYFPNPMDAVTAASKTLQRLDHFNESENKLSLPFRFRIGIHTGRSLVDLDQGVAYSPVLDVAGHLQKLADHNGLLISEKTMEALPEDLPFEKAGTMEREGLVYYRLASFL